MKSIGNNYLGELHMRINIINLSSIFKAPMLTAQLKVFSLSYTGG